MITQKDEGKSMESSLVKPKVSIIIPTFNSENTLSQCLKGVLSQSYPFYEVIVVDNFSNDGTVRIANEFGVKILQQKCNPALARNAGINNSTGEHILFLDSDQILSAAVINECVEKCEYEKAGMVHIPEVFIGEGFWSSCSAVWKNYYVKFETLNGAIDDIAIGKPRFFVKEHIIRAGMLDAGLLWGEDFELYNRLKKMSIKESSCKSQLFHYEPLSIKNILVKNFHYGKSMPVFRQQTRKQVFPLLFKQALLTFRKVFRDFQRSPSIIAGCAILLYLKTYSTMMGLIAGFIRRFSR